MRRFIFRGAVRELAKLVAAGSGRPEHPACTNPYVACVASTSIEAGPGPQSHCCASGTEPLLIHRTEADPDLLDYLSASAASCLTDAVPALQAAGGLEGAATHGESEADSARGQDQCHALLINERPKEHPWHQRSHSRPPSKTPTPTATSPLTYDCTLNGSRAASSLCAQEGLHTHAHTRTHTHAHTWAGRWGH